MLLVPEDRSTLEVMEFGSKRGADRSQRSPAAAAPALTKRRRAEVPLGQGGNVRKSVPAGRSRRQTVLFPVGSQCSFAAQHANRPVAPDARAVLEDRATLPGAPLCPGRVVALRLVHAAADDRRATSRLDALPTT